ncbi:hypothetical protein HMI54_003521, partial [Coelomomyces lativittatus]
MQHEKLPYWIIPSESTLLSMIPKPNHSTTLHPPSNPINQVHLIYGPFSLSSNGELSPSRIETLSIKNSAQLFKLGKKKKDLGLQSCELLCGGKLITESHPLNLPNQSCIMVLPDSPPSPSIEMDSFMRFNELDHQDEYKTVDWSHPDTLLAFLVEMASDEIPFEFLSEASQKCVDIEEALDMAFALKVNAEPINVVESQSSPWCGSTKLFQGPWKASSSPNAVHEVSLPSSFTSNPTPGTSSTLEVSISTSSTQVIPSPGRRRPRPRPRQKKRKKDPPDLNLVVDLKLEIDTLYERRTAWYAKAHHYYHQGSKHLGSLVAQYYSELARTCTREIRLKETERAVLLVEHLLEPCSLDLHGCSVYEGETAVRAWLHLLTHQPATSFPFKIVVGLGKHSSNGNPKLGPAIAAVLKKEKVKFTKHPGVFLIHEH